MAGFRVAEGLAPGSGIFQLPEKPAGPRLDRLRLSKGFGFPFFNTHSSEMKWVPTENHVSPTELLSLLQNPPKIFFRRGRGQLLVLSHSATLVKVLPGLPQIVPTGDGVG